MIDRRFEYIRNQIIDEMIMEQQKSNDEKIQQLKEDIAINKEKLQKLEELQRTKSPAEEAYKDWWGEYPPTSPDADRRDIARWHGFQAGYYASQEPEENEWKTVALGFGENLSAIGPCGYYDFTPVEWYEWVVDTYEKNADELLPLVKRGIRKNEVKEYQPTPQELEMTLEKSGEFSIVSYNGETYYRNLYDGICGGWYKTDTDGEVFYLVEDETERKLEKLYQEQVVVEEPKKEQKWGDIVRESVKWCEEHREESVEDYLTPQGPQGPVGPGPGPKGVIVGYEPTPQTPDKIEENLREAFKKVQQTEEWKETQRKIDSNYDDMVKNPPEFLKFELGKTLEGLISDWMDDCVPAYSTWDYELGIAILIRRIEKWLPDFQSAAGSQNVDTELLVDGYNDALTKIKSKLRNKK